ncbi:hypothetical protein [Nocardia testacea]|uniref:hypothetical protein n=1 Tax=Nocardia testacea TaxID=248551 RepID=UPI0033D246FD
MERQTVELEQEDELSGAFRIAPQVPQIAKNLGWVPGPASPNLIESLKRLTVDMLAHFANKLISAPNYLIKVVIDSPDGRNASSAIPVFDT